MSAFTMDVTKLRDAARQETAKGAVTPAYRADKSAVLRMLDAALATEMICVLRYTQHSLAAEGIHADSVAKHFASHAQQEHDHALRLAKRIKQLGGKPDLSPDTLATRAHSEYKEANSLADMIKENLVAERIAIASYTEMIRFIGEDDPTSRRILESILANEEEHADEMADLLAAFDPREKLH